MSSIRHLKPRNQTNPSLLKKNLKVKTLSKMKIILRNQITTNLKLNYKKKKIKTKKKNNPQLKTNHNLKKQKMSNLLRNNKKRSKIKS